MSSSSMCDAIMGSMSAEFTRVGMTDKTKAILGAHCQDCVNGQVTDPPSHLPPIDTSDFTEPEIHEAIENLKNNKSRVGCVLSPILFALAIDWVLQQSTKDKGIPWLQGQRLSDLDFTDDIAGLAESTKDLQDLVSEIGSTAGGIGLTISGKKTKKMLTGSHSPPTSVFIDGKEVKTVQNFTYLGSSINSNGDMDNELDCRVGKASAAFNQLGKLWRNKKLSLKTKMRFYNSNVLSTLLYGCETWHLKLSQERRLDAFDSNNQTRQASRIVVPRRTEKEGAPKMNWRQTVERNLQAVSMSWKEALRLAADRGSCPTLTASCVTRRGSP
ncbi:hypothetical protein Bbelb_276240 [Branchiostoma belcheri]|nr:hypothetical protein Bbelb_276240 [Branchiostoma belcheri]